jgi:putative oxidoreductase
METIIQYHEPGAALIARVFLGMLFFFQGYDAVFNVKVSNVILTFEQSFRQKGLPRFFTVAGSWFTSITELGCGVLLILGLFTYPALYLLGANLLFAAFGFGFNGPVWDTKHVMPRLILLLFLLIIPPSWNMWGLDQLIFNAK